MKTRLGKLEEKPNGGVAPPPPTTTPYVRGLRTLWEAIFENISKPELVWQHFRSLEDNISFCIIAKILLYFETTQSLCKKKAIASTPVGRIRIFLFPSMLVSFTDNLECIYQQRSTYSLIQCGNVRTSSTFYRTNN